MRVVAEGSDCGQKNGSSGANIPEMNQFPLYVVLGGESSLGIGIGIGIGLVVVE